MGNWLSRETLTLIVKTLSPQSSPGTHDIDGVPCRAYLGEATISWTMIPESKESYPYLGRTQQLGMWKFLKTMFIDFQSGALGIAERI